MRHLFLRSTTLLAVLALAYTGCATKVAGLKQSANFNYGAILSGKMAVGGVASAVENFDEGKKSSYGNLLRTHLLEERKDYSVAPVGAVVNQIGKAKYNEMLNEFQTNGLLSEASLKLLSQKMQNSRFVTFARIENDQVMNDKNETASTNNKGETIPGSEKVVATSTRTITASLQVYDLKTGEVAWSGAITKSDHNQRQYEKEKELGLVSVIKAIKGTAPESNADKYPYPQAPDTQKLLARVFSGFAENLPEKN